MPECFYRASGNRFPPKACRNDVLPNKDSPTPYLNRCLGGLVLFPSLAAIAGRL